MVRQVYYCRNQTIKLRIRRHPRENFDPIKGHDACEALLILGKGEVEFQGLRDTSDNFKIPYNQIQLGGMQLKKGVALFLSTKVTVAGGKKREFNFYSFDNELSQAGAPYLTLVQQLLHAH